MPLEAHQPRQPDVSAQPRLEGGVGDAVDTLTALFAAEGMAVSVDGFADATSGDIKRVLEVFERVAPMGAVKPRQPDARLPRIKTP